MAKGGSKKGPKASAAARKARKAQLDRGHAKRRRLQRAEVMKLYAKGRSMRWIAEKIEMSAGYVHGLVQEGLAEVSTGEKAVREQLRAVRGHDLDMVIAEYRGLVLRDDLTVQETKETSEGPVVMELADFERKVKAGGPLLKAMEREAKLHGLDAPAMVQIGTGEGFTVLEFLARGEK